MKVATIQQGSRGYAVTPHQMGILPLMLRRSLRLLHGIAPATLLNSY